MKGLKFTTTSSKVVYYPDVSKIMLIASFKDEAITSIIEIANQDIWYIVNESIDSLINRIEECQ